MEVNEFKMQRALDHALQDSYMKYIKGDDAKLYSENWKSFIFDQFMKHLKED